MEYLIVLLTIVLFSFTSVTISADKRLYASLVLLLILFSGTRFETGNDWGEYLTLFNNVETSFIEEFAKSHRMEPGYIALNVLVKSLDGDLMHVFLICAAFTIGVISYSLKSYTPFVGVSLLLFMRYGFLQYDMMFVRQGIAVAIFIFSIRYIHHRSFRKYFLAILLATFFHVSAVILFPMYYILKRDYNKLLVVSIIMFSFIIGLTNWLTFVVINFPMEFGKLLSIRSYVLSEVWGVRKPFTFSMIEKITVILVALRYYGSLSKKNTYFIIFFNMSVISLIISFLFNNYYVFSERVGIIFNMGYVVLIGYFLYIINPKHRSIIIILLCAFVSYWFIRYITAIEVYLPYKNYFYG